ncbi:NAD(P)-dependent dehydrogenase (short-subunit alcohol dehydrogenase family) [Crossiella equi]|uniref:NAD(P)-dependent dehydrogenase (Short-subunit alcohol dehydrogenase family) n=1 Tax=Crossiella equi TaxID=130796 RepID=A0ABS5APX8_9PSEU|nr:SDR family NAD(P)-dependent oxidoreductase [Crossiella equi]MBP2478628.1 NAD(P)-dependent dehydrogenase (short-subunit alcohol dehydrogenase family) [Crossiella equi]
MDYQDFTDKIVLVIGGARGIGAGVVRAFAGRGATVVVADTDTLPSAVNHYRATATTGFAEAQELAAKLVAEGLPVTAECVNASDEHQVVALYQRLAERFGRLDVVVNAFGVTHVSPVEKMELAQFQQIVSGNLDGVFLSCKHALPLLRANGGGAIVNFSSVSGKSGFAKVAHYCAAKAGVIGFSNSLALEVAKDGITVNSVCPGIVRSNMWQYLFSEFQRPTENEEEFWDRMRSMIPQKQFQEPEDIAEGVVFLASSPRVTGQALGVDGGMTA